MIRFIIITILGLFICSFQIVDAAEEKLVSISPVSLQWNIEKKQFDAFFQVVNKTGNDTELTSIIIFKRGKYKRWRGVKLGTIPKNRTVHYMMSFDPGIMVKNDYISITVNLYGKSYRGLIDHSARQMNIQSRRTIIDDKLVIELLEKDLNNSNAVKTRRISLGLAKNLSKLTSNAKNYRLELRAYIPEVLKAGVVSKPIQINRKDLFKKEIKQKVVKIKKEKIQLGPPILTTALQNKSIILTWDPVPNAKSYNLYWSTSKTINKETGQQIKKVKSGYRHTGLDNDTTYYFVVTSVNKKEESIESWRVSATTKKRLQPPILTAESGFQKTRLQWAEVKQAKRYHLYWNLTGNTDKNHSHMIPNVKTGYQHENLKPGIKYFYRVIYVNEDEESVVSNTVISIPAHPLPAPKIKISSDIQKNTVSWEPVKNATHYNVYWRITKSIDPTKAKKIKTIKTRFEHTQLSSGAKYGYIVTAENQYGESTPSNIVFSSPQAPFEVDLNTEKEDPDTLIYSTSHGVVNYLLTRKGLLEIEIASFNPILYLDVNGDVRKVSRDSQTKFQISFELKGKIVAYTITAITSEGRAQKTFTFHFGKKPKPAKSPFQLITILGLTQTDNLNSSPASTTPVSETKLALTAVPQYNIKIDQDSALKIKGIVLREKYSHDKYKAKETSFTQLAFEWIESKTFLGKLTGGIGLNDIRLDNSDFLLGKTQSSSETFIYGKSQQKISKKITLKLHLQFKNKTSYTDVTSADDNADSNEISIKPTLNFPILFIKNKITAGVSQNDAVGKYQDSSSMEIKMGQTFPLGNWTPTWAYSVKQTNKSEVDSRLSVTGIKTENTLGTAAIKINYKLFPKTRVGFTFKNKKQSSNVQNLNYKNNVATLSMIHIF